MGISRSQRYLEGLERRKLSVSCVPKAEARVANFSVPYGENRRSELDFQGQNTIQLGHPFATEYDYIYPTARTSKFK